MIPSASQMSFETEAGKIVREIQSQASLGRSSTIQIITDSAVYNALIGKGYKLRQLNNLQYEISWDK